MARTGKIILAKNIKMDKNYKAVLNYTEQQIINLLSIQSNLVYQALDYQFIRDRGTIKVNCPYSQALQANYMAFQNPDYSGKWFFAFIDEVKFLGGQGTDAEIVYTLDVWTTWFEYWSAKSCFVLREHVVDDSIGSNTVPESVELGEYISTQNETEILSSPTSDFYFCMAVTALPDNSLPTFNNHLYNGLYSGLVYLVFTSQTYLNNAIAIYAASGKMDYIYAVFIVPKNMSSINDGTLEQWTKSGITTQVIYMANSNTADTVGVLNGTFPSHVGKTYVPKNKKLYTNPYSYMMLDNNSGQCETYFYEDFVIAEGATTPTIAFWVDATISIGMSMKAIPIAYKNNNMNYSYGLALGKLPVCSWVSDAYTNWLTQNGLNITTNLATTTSAQLVSGNFGGAVGTIAGSMTQIYQRSQIPYQSQGNLGIGDINFSDPYDGGLTLYYMSIRDEYAERIDQYFTRRGYAVNKVKTPNMTKRENYNYVQIASDDNVAYPNNHNNISIPARPLEQINNMFRSGVTIWNNHTNFGDYSVSNLITQN